MHTNSNNHSLIRWLTYLMFMMFAMTTDAVGKIIPEIMSQFNLGYTKAGLIHYAPMAAIAVSGLCLGFLADKFGRKQSMILGLAIFAVASFCFLLGHTFYYFLSLMVLSGLAIGIFKTAALALIGDISSSAKQHTATVNGVEAFFAVGAILGPLIVTQLLLQGLDWQWLYFIAGILCTLLIVAAGIAKYPATVSHSTEPVKISQSFKLLKDPYALCFSLGAFLYVATESAIYVWMPSYLLGYSGQPHLVLIHALTFFFVLRAAGRFLGMWFLSRFDWTWVLMVCSGAVFVCFALSVWLGVGVAAYMLPLSGLFMSVIYPTLNSKGISCFEKNKHGTVAGVILFFTALGAAAGPLLMGIVSDLSVHKALAGFVVATGFSCVLFLGLVFNYIKSPTENRLRMVESKEY